MADLFERIDNSWSYRHLLAIIAGGITLFFLWAAFSPIDEQVRGVGKIIPSGKVRMIQHLEGGIIKEILVEEGQSVNEGDTLFVIENTEAQTSRQEITITIDALKIKLARLKAERENLNDFVVPEELTESYPEIAQTEKALLRSRREEFLSKISGLEERRSQKRLTLETLRERLSNLREESEIARKQQGINKNLRELGAVSQSRYLESQSIVKNFETRIADVQKQIPVTEAERLEIDQTLLEQKQNYQAGVSEEINKVEIDIRKLQERQVNFSDKVARTTVSSPVKGIISARHVDTIGGVIKPGATLVDILPVDETLVVEGQIPTNDRGKVYAGLNVEAVITAYDFSVYGSISGKLTEISADSFSDQQGREFYRVRAELSASGFAADLPLHSGMTVQLNILTGRTSVLRAILKPLFRLREDALKEA